MKKKSIDCYCEIEVKKSKWKTAPNIWFDKPNENEIKNSHEFGYKYYKAKIILGEEIKWKKKK